MIKIRKHKDLKLQLIAHSDIKKGNTYKSLYFSTISNIKQKNPSIYCILDRLHTVKLIYIINNDDKW